MVKCYCLLAAEELNNILNIIYCIIYSTLKLQHASGTVQCADDQSYTDQVNYFSLRIKLWGNYLSIILQNALHQKDQTIAHPHTQLMISVFQRTITLEFDPEPVIKKSLNMAVFFWSSDGATMQWHGCC